MHRKQITKKKMDVGGCRRRRRVVVGNASVW